MSGVSPWPDVHRLLHGEDIASRVPVSSGVHLGARRKPTPSGGGGGWRCGPRTGLPPPPPPPPPPRHFGFTVVGAHGGRRRGRRRRWWPPGRCAVLLFWRLASELQCDTKRLTETAQLGSEGRPCRQACYGDPRRRSRLYICRTAWTEKLN